MKFLVLLVFVSVSVASVYSQDLRNQINPNWAPFYHGVASGDPLSDRVIIWTRVTPESVDEASIDGTWRVATDTSMTNIVTSGNFTTSQERDYTVKIDVIGLEPSTCYYYDFKVGERYSIRGRAITADSGDNEHVRLAVVSCSNYQYGYFNAYRDIANRNDVQAVLHLGDYIYEYEVGGYSANIEDRKHEPEHETVTLEDYRLRYSHYRLDNDLQLVHQQYPFICVWDDHESADDSFVDGADNHDENTQGDWHVRKNNSKQAYFEWMPIREEHEGYSIYRTIGYGDLINLYMLDTRLEGRDEQVGIGSSALNDPERSILGEEQREWFLNELSNSSKKWNIIGQQVMMAPLRAFGQILNPDQWDGYNAERQLIYNHIIDNDIENIVVLTGDIHTSWANELPGDGYVPATGENSVGVEFVTTSVTSPGLPIGIGTTLVRQFNPHCKWVNLNLRGYMVLDVTIDKVQSEWYLLDNVSDLSTQSQFTKAFYVNNGERTLNESQTSASAQDICILAPENPIKEESLSVAEETHKPHLYGVYPNPFQDELILHFGTVAPESITVTIIDSHGREVIAPKTLVINSASEYLKIYTSSLSKGSYQLVVTTKDSVTAHKIIKID